MHIETLFLNWGPNLSEDAIDANLRQLIKIPWSVPDIMDVYAGKNYSKHFPEYTHAVIAYAKDEGALTALRYQLMRMCAQNTITLKESTAHPEFVTTLRAL